MGNDKAFQPAVSPAFCRQGALVGTAPKFAGRSTSGSSAGHRPAIQQTKSLRYLRGSVEMRPSHASHAAFLDYTALVPYRAHALIMRSSLPRNLSGLNPAVQDLYYQLWDAIQAEPLGPEA